MLTCGYAGPPRALCTSLSGQFSPVLARTLARNIMFAAAIREGYMATEVKLPGIEDAYSAVDQRKPKTSQHSVTWRNMSRYGIPSSQASAAFLSM